MKIVAEIAEYKNCSMRDKSRNLREIAVETAVKTAVKIVAKVAAKVAENRCVAV